MSPTATQWYAQVVHGSMRIAVHLRPGGTGDDITFWALLVPWELGYLPLSKSASARLLEVGWRRRREWLDWTDALRDGKRTVGVVAGSKIEEQPDAQYSRALPADARRRRQVHPLVAVARESMTGAIVGVGLFDVGGGTQGRSPLGHVLAATQC